MVILSTPKVLNDLTLELQDDEGVMNQ